jgi:hypothetical protein
VSLILDALFEDLGVAEAHHDVVWLEVGMNDMTFSVHVVQALEKGWDEFAEVVAAKEVARQSLHCITYKPSESIANDTQVLPMRAFELE